ncbi:MAG: hypothetical protein WA081_00640 [Desulfosalsimonadaceae bacterium]
MSTMIIVEGESLEDAKKELSNRVTKWLHAFSEKIISDGKPQTLKITANTQEEAFQVAESRIPNNAQILQKSLINTPNHSVVKLRAFDEENVKAEVLKQFGDSVLVVNTKLLTSGRKGLFGMGKTPHHYEVEIFQQAAVEITYKSKAQISAKIGTLDEMMADPDKVNAFFMAAIIKTIESQCLPGLKEKDINKIFQAAVPLFYREWKEFFDAQTTEHMNRLSKNQYDPVPKLQEQDVFQIADRVVRRARGLL